MTKKAKKPQFSVAMSQDTGCIVMVRSNGAKVTVIGSLTREDSLTFADSVIDWAFPDSPSNEAATEGDVTQRPAYPH